MCRWVSSAGAWLAVAAIWHVCCLGGWRLKRWLICKASHPCLTLPFLLQPTLPFLRLSFHIPCPLTHPTPLLLLCPPPIATTVGPQELPEAHLHLQPGVWGQAGRLPAAVGARVWAQRGAGVCVCGDGGGGKGRLRHQKRGREKANAGQGRAGEVCPASQPVTRYQATHPAQASHLSMCAHLHTHPSTQTSPPSHLEQPEDL